MAGFIRPKPRIGKNGKRYYDAILDLGIDSNGKRIRKWKAFERRKEADAWLTEQKGKVTSGTYAEPTKKTLRGLLEEWLDVGAPSRKSGEGLKTSTLTGYRDIAERYIYPRIGQLKAVEVTPARLNALLGTLLAGGGHATKASPEGKPLSPRTVIYTATILKACLAWAVRERKLPMNAAEGLRLPARHPVRDSGERIWSGEQRRRFLTGCMDSPLFAAFHLAAHTGMRRGEICGLRWQDLDFQARRLTVVRNRVLVRQKQANQPARVEVVDTTPKRGKGRTIHLDPGTVDVLHQHRMKQLQDVEPDGDAPTDVFTDGLQRLSPDTLSYRFELAVKASGLPYLSLHGLRHTWATLALQAGVPVQVVSQMLGHTSVSVTWNVYQHVVPSMQSEAAAKVAAL